MILENRYQLGEVIWSDACVALQRGYDQLLNRAVTIERLQSQCATDPVAVNRLLETGRQLAIIELPHVAALYDQGDEAGVPFLVFEEILGQELRGAAPLPAVQVAPLLTQVAETLRVAGERNAITPPLTAETVRWIPDGRVQIVHTGFAQPATATVPMDILGQLLAVAVTGREDGVTLNAVAPALRQVVDRALANNYATPEALLHDLRAAQQQAAAPTITVTPPRPTIEISDEEFASVDVDEVAVQPVSARRGLGRSAIIALLSTVLLASIIGGVLVLRRPAARAGGATATPNAVNGQTAGATVTAGANATAVGQAYVVNAAGNGRLNVRSAPDAAAPTNVIGVLTNGTVVQVLDGPTQANGLNWAHIRVGNLDGYCLYDALRKQ